MATSFTRMDQSTPEQWAVIHAEGPKHPDLTAYYFDQVISGGMDALRQLINRGVRHGEFRQSDLDEFPQLMISPVLMSIIWRTLFQKHYPLDTDKLLQTHIDLILRAIKLPPGDTPGGAT